MTATAPIKPTTGAGWTARLGWGIAAAALAVLAVVSVANMQSGMHGDPRTTNPVRDRRRIHHSSASATGRWS